MKMTVCLVLIFGLFVLAVAQGQPAAGARPDEAQMLARSLVSMGDTTRLQHVLAKAARGEKVVVAVIGGSITAGAAASREEFRWGNRVAQWWRDTFPKTEIGFVNAGIGATGSNIACHRAQKHLLDFKPDFVVAEFGVNDGNDQLHAETLEGLTRQVLEQPNQPAMMLLFTMNNAGNNAQEWHGKIGQYYGLPMVSFRDALWPEIQAGRIKWEDVEADMVHPNDRGHKYCADYVDAVAAKVLADLPANLPPIPPLPAPLISDVFERATFFNAETITPTKSDGFTQGDAWPFGKCWEATQPGSTLEFDVSGTTISLCFLRIKKDMGIAEAQVDDRPAVKLDAWFDQTWGGYSAWEMIARDLPPGTHKLRIKVLDEKSPGSDGHRFQLQAVMAAGR